MFYQKIELGRRSLRGDVHVSDHVADFFHGRLVQSLVALLRRFSAAPVTTFMTACSACRFEIFEDRLTCMARPSNVHPNRLEFSSGRRERLLRITRITFRIFPEFGPDGR